MNRPKTRGECVGQARPCPWVTCRYHLFVDIVPNVGRLRMPHGDDLAALDTMVATCALDVAEKGDISLGEAGAHLGLTAERVRQEESAALRKLRAASLPGTALTTFT